MDVILHAIKKVAKENGPDDIYRELSNLKYDENTDPSNFVEKVKFLLKGAERL